jgi:hypothetical protein
MTDPDSYCREIEAYLCRKNDGHLIRIVGPAFEQVSRWAQNGVPIKVACAGIDRYFERYYRKGPRRRPVRIEFCEADVLDAFDDWRRAVGVALPIAGSYILAPPDAADEAAGQGGAPGRRRISLAGHIERVIARLTTLGASSRAAGEMLDSLERVTRELDALQGEARRARGEAREAVIRRLRVLDGTLITAAAGTASEAVRLAAEAEARAMLGPFRDRMIPEAYQRARAAAIERHIRDHFGLPVVTFD